MATRTYENEDLTVFWDSSRCIHTGICLRSLPGVFDLRSRPWVQVDGARIRTVEGLAPAPGRLSVLQEAFRRHHAMTRSVNVFYRGKQLTKNPGSFLRSGRISL